MSLTSALLKFWYCKPYHIKPTSSYHKSVSKGQQLSCSWNAWVEGTGLSGYWEKRGIAWGVAWHVGLAPEARRRFFSPSCPDWLTERSHSLTKYSCNFFMFKLVLESYEVKATHRAELKAYNEIWEWGKIELFLKSQQVPNFAVVLLLISSQTCIVRDW